MYDWLTNALGDDSSHVVTANRRLARTLTEQFSQQQIASGQLAWRRAAVHSWNDWLAVLIGALHDSDELPLRINAQQSRLLWEQCLQQDIDDPLIGIGGLARLCRETWLRMHEWCVPLSECQNRASGADQRIFARAAGRYAAALAERRWIDDAGLPDRLTELVRAGHIETPNVITLAGFDRLTPQASALVDAFTAAGATKTSIDIAARGTATLRRYDNSDAELRAAGAWARAALEENASLTIAIVVSNLEQDAERNGRLLREGFVPGWQCGTAQLAAALNLSYGRRLADYPAIHAALMALRWLYRDLRGAEISQLLRSPYVGKRSTSGRSQLELKLRDLPDRNWSRELLQQALSRSIEHADVEDWFERLGRISTMLNEGEARRRPSEWAAFFDAVLKTLNWPGEGALTSTDFQLDNRWRQLLNEFSRLELVSSTMRGADAVARLMQMAGDALFQAEAEAPIVSVLGPLEAAGLKFDRLWVTGLAAADWPPPSRPLVLLSRELQRSYGMPDATPDDTAAYANRVVQRLRSSAAQVVFSYPETVGDAYQIPTALLADIDTVDGNDDPGWYAASFAAPGRMASRPDRIPTVTRDEIIYGGAATINRQLHDPFSAFAHGRLGIRWLPEFSPGISAIVRGNLLHDALFRLYADRPGRGDMLAWSDDEISRRVERAVRAAFSRHERFADSVLRQLLSIEQRRARSLLQAVIAVDRSRTDFQIDSIESSLDATIGAIRLRLRCDRIDRVADGKLVILDYKSGQTRRFLTSGRPADMQLVVYACAVAEPVAGLGLFNVDSRQVSIDGVGPALNSLDTWQQNFDEWQQAVHDAASRIAAGDVRLNIRQSSRDARVLSLLSRYAEIRHDG